MKRYLPLLLLLALPVVAQEETPPDEPRLVGAMWCPVRLSEPGEDDPTCDVGVGIALYRRERAFLAGVLGSKTVGFGLGWTAYRGPLTVVAVALGVIAPYDERGIQLEGWAPALGCTLGLKRPD